MFRKLRIIAKVWSIISAIFIIVFIIGYSLDLDEALPKGIELLEFSLFPIGVIIGQFIAWKKEGLGSFITIVSLVLFYILEFMLKGRFPGGPYFILVAAPGILFLICKISVRRLNTRK